METIGEEGDEDVRFDALDQLMVDRTQSQIVLEGLERRLDFGELDIESPQLGRLASGRGRPVSAPRGRLPPRSLSGVGPTCRGRGRGGPHDRIEERCRTEPVGSCFRPPAAPCMNEAIVAGTSALPASWVRNRWLSRL